MTSSGTTEDHNTTESGRGKPKYRAPELLREGRKTFNKKTDVWSLGCILHDLCVGKSAFLTDIAVFEYASRKKPLEIIFPPAFLGAADIIFGMWICEMIDWDPSRRPTLEALGKRFWQFLYLVITPSPISRTTYANTDLLLSENLLGTDSPNAMTKQIPPKWEHVLFQGHPHSHNIATLERAKQIAAAREKLLGESHSQTIHSKIRLAWTCFYMCPTCETNPSQQFEKLLELQAREKMADPETVSFLAGIGWSEYISENYDKSSQMFEKALEIQYQCDRVTDTDSLSYSVALAKVQIELALINMKKSGQKRKRSGVDDMAPARSLVERAINQLHLNYNCQRSSPQVGKEHPETAETMLTLARGYQILAKIRKSELTPAKVLKQYYQSAEIFLKEALEVELKSLGDDHPLTLLTLYEVGYLDLMKGRKVEAVQTFEETLVKQKYTLGIDDPDTQATLNSLREGYKACGETIKLKELSNPASVVSSRERGRRSRICDLANRTDNEGDSRRVDQVSSQASPSQGSL